jgi:ribosomal protein S18 acetylase RimI-like enzyme
MDHRYDVRRAVADDALALTALAKAAKAGLGYRAEWLVAWDEALTVDAAYVDRHRVWLASEPGLKEPAGFVALVDEGALWRIDHLWIAPEHQRRGLGRRLWEVAVAAARNIRAGPVRVEAEPLAAGFYERCGARRVGSVAAPLLDEARELPVFEIIVSALR